MKKKYSTDQPVSGWVLYDGNCGFCSWWIETIGGFLRRRGFEVTELQTPWVQNLIGPDDDLTSHFRLLTPTGEEHRGADAYRFLCKSIWWLKPVYAFSVVPVGRQIFNLAYKTFDDNRYAISDVWARVAVR